MGNFITSLIGIICTAVLLAPNNGWTQYLTGTDRSSFVEGAINGCMRPKNTDPLTAAVPMDLFAEYCRCYANGVADRVSINDLKANNRAVTDPIGRDVTKVCYEAMKSAAIKRSGGYANCADINQQATASRDALVVAKDNYKREFMLSLTAPDKDDEVKAVTSFIASTTKMKKAMDETIEVLSRAKAQGCFGKDTDAWTTAIATFREQSEDFGKQIDNNRQILRLMQEVEAKKAKRPR
jgi:hypothetical protein